jgi:hypothetical protein
MIEEATMFVENDLLVPVDWHLLAGWNISKGGLTILPLPRGAELEGLIARRICVLLEVYNEYT